MADFSFELTISGLSPPALHHEVLLKNSRKLEFVRGEIDSFSRNKRERIVGEKGNIVG